jgi:copper chaperone NosL
MLNWRVRFDRVGKTGSSKCRCLLPRTVTDESIHSASQDCSVERRPLLAAGGAVAASTLGGCLDLGGREPAAVAIDEGAQCDVCGMVIPKHPGPNGQLFYEDESPEGHDNPAWFDSLKKCFFPYKLEHERRDWSVAAMYVTDYSAVEYELSTSDGRTYISSHTDPASFADARELHYVVESDVHGAMGPDFYPFSERADAEAFAADHGGRVLEFEDIGAGVVGN